MQQDFQHRKIRQAESGSGNTAGVQLGEGSVGFHENQPEMDSGSVSGSGPGVAHGVIFTSRYIRRKIFFALSSGDYDFNLRIDVDARHFRKRGVNRSLQARH